MFESDKKQGAEHIQQVGMLVVGGEHVCSHQEARYMQYSIQQGDILVGPLQAG